MALLAHQLISWVLPGQPYGNQADGSYSSATIPTMLPDSCSGTATSTTLTTAGSTFANGDILMVVQMRGTGAGQWEIVRVASGGGSTSLTLTKSLVYTYTDSGASQAQAIKIPQYSSVTVQSGTWTVPSWDGNKNGVLVFACRNLTVTGNISANGKGYRGGSGGLRDQYNASSGESYDTDRVQAAAVIGTRATAHGGASGCTGAYQNNTGLGGGAGYGAAGGGSYAGSTYGVDTLTTIFPGSGASGGYADAGADFGGLGGYGGGIICIYAGDVAISGTISSNGSTGEQKTSYSGGHGSGGSILLLTKSVSLGTNLLTTSGASATYGGAGGNGRIAVYYGSSLTGSISSTYYGSLVTSQDTRLLYPVRRGMFI